MSDAREPDTEDLDKIIVGLGNPGQRYRASRHNVGFMVADALARQADGTWAAHLASRVCKVEISGHPALLVKPLTYMNRSGEAVHALMAALRRSPENLILVYDDLDLPLGRIRIRERGSAGGHRGLESILEVFGTEEIMRVRLGIGEEQMPDDKIDFVLSDFPPEKRIELDEMIIKAGDAVKSILSNGVSQSMTIFNA
ncbi:MAG: aminoacyl-tRNA hydrolase [Acidobacteria bacterium]|nr:aminoacyl-tRNA hydrolase [Acidobacteriota bacterium]